MTPFSTTFIPANSNLDPTPKTHILILYTGGTIGCFYQRPGDSDSALVVRPWKDLRKHLPQLGDIDINIDVLAFDKALDSTDMRPEYWAGIAQLIYDNYHSYMGFVILHGTDTMVYTASALSFMLHNLGKPVVLTGSQIPIAEHPRNDGVQNLIGAIYVAAYEIYSLPRISEVVIVFGGHILRGNRTRKISASGFDGFYSPNIEPLGSLGEEIEIHRDRLLHRPDQDRSHPDSDHFNASYDLDPSVASLIIYPGIQTSESFKAILQIPSLRGIVLQCYGAGNAPTDPPEFLESIHKAIRDKGKHILDVTQCTNGAVKLGQYATGEGLLNIGVLSGSDITPEAALCKLMYLLGRYPDDTPEQRELVAAEVQQSLAGEQSSSIHVVIYKAPQTGWRISATKDNDSVRLYSGTKLLIPDFRADRVKHLVLHLGQITVIPASSRQATIELDISLNNRRVASSANADEGKSVPVPAPEYISFKLDHVKRYLLGNETPRIEIKTLSSAGEISWNSAKLYVFMDSK